MQKKVQGVILFRLQSNVHLFQQILIIKSKQTFYVARQQIYIQIIKILSRKQPYQVLFFVYQMKHKSNRITPKTSPKKRRNSQNINKETIQIPKIMFKTANKINRSPLTQIRGKLNLPEIQVVKTARNELNKVISQFQPSTTASSRRQSISKISSLTIQNEISQFRQTNNLNNFNKIKIPPLPILKYTDQHQDQAFGFTIERKLIKQSYKQYPYKCIGRVLTCNVDQQVQSQFQIPYSTAFIIGQRVVITTGHTLYSNRLRKLPDQVFFKLEVGQNQPECLLKVVRYGIDERFFDKKYRTSQNYDLALLILQQNNRITPEMCLKLNLTSQIQQIMNNKSQIINKNIFVSGYPYQQNSKKEFRQYQVDIDIQSKQNNLITYRYNMKVGFSGSPLISKKLDANREISYQVIGIHKLGKYSQGRGSGVLLNFKQNQLYGILQNLQVNKIQQFAEQTNKINQIQKELGFIQSKQQFYDNNYFVSKGIRWNKTIYYYHKLEYFIISDDNKNSFRNSINQIIQALQTTRNDQLLLQKQTWKFIFSRFKHLKLNHSQKQYFLSLILHMAQINSGYRKSSNQYYKCQQISKQLHIFQNRVYYKTKSFIQKYDKQYKDQLNQECMIIKQKIIQNIKPNLLEQQLLIKRKKQLNMRQMVFYRCYFYFQKAKDCSQIQPDNFPSKQKQIDYTVLGKAITLEKAGNYQDALFFYQQYLQACEKNQNIQEEVKVLHWIGSVYTQKNDFKKAYQTYLLCLKRKQQLFKQKLQCHSYAITLNSFAVVAYRQFPNSQLALQYFIKCIKIWQKIANKSKQNDSNSLQLQKTRPQTTRQPQICQKKSKDNEFQSSQSSKTGIIMKQHKLNQIQNTNEFLASAYTNVGMIYKQRKNYQQALKNFKKSLKILEQKYGADSIQSFAANNNIAGIYYQSQNYQRALKQYMNCLNILKRVYIGNYDYNNPPLQQQFAMIFNNIAFNYFKQEKLDDAIYYIEKSFKLYKQILGNDNDLTLQSRNMADLMLEHRQYHYKKLQIVELRINVQKNCQNSQQKDRNINGQRRINQQFQLQLDKYMQAYRNEHKILPELKVKRRSIVAWA